MDEPAYGVCAENQLTTDIDKPVVLNYAHIIQLDNVSKQASGLSSVNVKFLTMRASEESHLTSGDSSLSCAPFQNEILKFDD